MKTLTTPYVYDAECVGHLLGIPYDAEDLAMFGPPPAAPGDYVTFFDPGMPLATQRRQARMLGYLRCDDVYDRFPWAHRWERPRYRSLRVTVPGSFNRSLENQRTLLRSCEGIASIRAVTQVIVLHALATGEWLLPRLAVRCAEYCGIGQSVVVDSFDHSHLFIANVDAGLRSSALGLAAEKVL